MNGDAHCVPPTRETQASGPTRTLTHAPPANAHRHPGKRSDDARSTYARTRVMYLRASRIFRTTGVSHAVGRSYWNFRDCCGRRSVGSHVSQHVGRLRLLSADRSAYHRQWLDRAAWAARERLLRQQSGDQRHAPEWVQRLAEREFNVRARLYGQRCDFPHRTVILVR